MTPTRGPDTLPTFRENERVLAGFEDGRADEGAGAGESSLLGLRIALLFIRTYRLYPPG